MKLSKAEIASIILTAVFILAAGLLIFFRPGAYTVSVLPSAGEEQSAAPATEPLNINTAQAEALDTLPGVGPALASRIIAFREENGLFKSTADIMQVEGIGPETFDKIKPLITVN